MQRDIRGTPLYAEALAAAHEQAQPGSGTIVYAQELHASSDGRMAAFAGTVFDKLEGSAPTRICTVDLQSGEKLIRTFGHGRDRFPRWSPDGTTIAFLSDRDRPGDFQIYLLNTSLWHVRPGPRHPGFVEYIEWSHDGRQLLAGVAGGGADMAGAQGGTSANVDTDTLPEWMPDIDDGPAENQWRRAWVADLASGQTRCVSPQGVNVWESCWLGADAVAAIASDSPDEAAWYSATVRRFSLLGGEAKTVFTPMDQLGGLAASATGQHLGVIEAFCSDRTVVAGEVVLLSDKVPAHKLDTKGCDVSKFAFIDEDRIIFAGHRSFETMLGTIGVSLAKSELHWMASDCTFGGSRYPDFAVLPGARLLATVEAFVRRPAICVLDKGNKTITVTEVGDAQLAAKVEALVSRVEAVRWTAPDGLEIHGWLILPRLDSKPPPLVMDIHGGPVWLWRQSWLGSHLARRLLLARGYAVFLPNPRGSSGRGQDFARRVRGDMGGADTRDYLSGIDHLVARQCADAHNLFVYGVSYGGFMTSWLITQDKRFAAAAPISPVTNWYSEHLTCNIASFCETFLGESMREAGGKYFERSPVFHAHQVTTPTLNIAGNLDKNTPSGQALEFHHALLEYGVKSELAIYPTEGHGIRGQYPAMADFVARVVQWFDEHRR